MKKITILEIVLIIRIIFSAYKLYTYFSDLNSSKNQYNEVNDIISGIRNKSGNSKINLGEVKDEDKYQSIEIFKELKKLNSDIIGYLEVEGLPIEYPVVQAEDNDYYLRRDLNEEYSVPGTVFMDYRNDPKMTDQNVVIYGHNMNNDTMFGSMDKLGNQEFVDNNGENFIRYTTDHGIFVYKIISYFQVTDTYDYRTPTVSDEEWIAFLNKTNSMSETDFGVDLKFDKDTKILTLSTCADDTNYRNVVQAIFVEKY